MYLALTTFVICKSLKNDYLNVTIIPIIIQSKYLSCNNRKLSCVPELRIKSRSKEVQVTVPVLKELSL